MADMEAAMQRWVDRLNNKEVLKTNMENAASKVSAALSQYNSAQANFQQCIQMAQANCRSFASMANVAEASHRLLKLTTVSHRQNAGVNPSGQPHRKGLVLPTGDHRHASEYPRSGWCTSGACDHAQLYAGHHERCRP
jgi:ABC-type transporter Mla subunit MlaD